MSTVCPRCQKTVSLKAIACPHCNTPLKALGHQGIPLHQATGVAVLCDTCTYHQDDSCNYPQRPLAKDCIMYVDMRLPQDPPLESVVKPISMTGRIQYWVNNNLALVILVGLAILSLLLVLAQ